MGTVKNSTNDFLVRNKMILCPLNIWVQNPSYDSENLKKVFYMILPWGVLCCQTKNRCKIRQN